MSTIAEKTFNYTCTACVVIRNILIGIWVGAIAMGESAGRARAAKQLSSMGLHEEAKALMLEIKKIEKDIG